MAFLGGLFGSTHSGLSGDAKALIDKYEAESRAASEKQIGYLSTAGTQARSDITRGATEDLGTLQASLAARGLSNTSVYNSMAQRIREGEQRNLAGVNENVAREKAAYVYQPNAGLASQEAGLANTQVRTPGLLSGIGGIAGAALGSVIPGVGTAIGSAIGGGLEGAATGQGVGQGLTQGMGYGALLNPYLSPGGGQGGQGGGFQNQPGSQTGGWYATGGVKPDAWSSLSPVSGGSGYSPGGVMGGWNPMANVTGASEAPYDPYADLRAKNRKKMGGSEPTTGYD